MLSTLVHDLHVHKGLQSVLFVGTLEFTSERMGWDYDKIRKISQNS